YGRDMFNRNVDVFPQALAKRPLDTLPEAGPVQRGADDLHPCVTQGLLDDPEGFHAWNVAQHIDQRQAVQHAAIGSRDEVRAATLYTSQHGQAAPAGTRRTSQCPDIAGTVAYKGEFTGKQMGDDNLSACAGGQAPAVRVDN